MVDVKRWSVTYTKHIKQKRKVYQDGFLKLDLSSQKMMLYDDCEKLIGVKILKNDDVVVSGETLAFDAYLVDIGDLDGDCKPIPNLNCQVRDKKITEKAGLFQGKKLKDNSVSAGDRKTISGKKKAPSSSLSPSQKIIREFKKNEMSKYGGPRNSPDATKTSNTEWQVLYTTQITQKAKKYHDGFLRVAACGSQRRQVTLYDLSRRILDCRFLKKDEVIGSGETLGFDGHLVDIGEPEGNHKPLLDSKAQGNSCTGGSTIGFSHGQQTGNKSSFGMPIRAKLMATLLDENGTVLSRKFLKLSEEVKSGSSLQLSTYLVEVGEPYESPEGEPSRIAFSRKDVNSNFSASVDSESRKRDPTDKALRDANDILSILRKSTTQQSSPPTKTASLGQCHVSQSLDYIDCEIQNHVERHVGGSNGERHGADHHTIELVKSADSKTRGESHLKYFTPCFSLGEELCDLLVPNSDGECMGKSILKPVSSIKEPQVKLEPRVPLPHHDGSNGNTESNLIESMSSKAATSCHSNRLPKETNTKTCSQPVEENKRDTGRPSFEVCEDMNEMDNIPSFDLGF